MFMINVDYSSEFYLWLSHFVLAEVNESRKQRAEQGGDREDCGDIITCEVPRITNDKDQRRMTGAQ